MIHADTLKAIGIFTLGVLLSWRLMTWLAIPAACPPLAPPPVETPDARLTRQLCDREVDALLHSHELADVERAIAIVKLIPCAIERRL